MRTGPKAQVRTRRWSRLRRAALALGLIATTPGVAAAAPAPAAKKAPSKAAPGKAPPLVEDPTELPLPPGDSVDAPSDSGDEFGDPAPLTQQQREEEFDLHLSRAQRAEREGRVDDAMREYTAALKLMPGDPDALKGRAYLRFKRTKENTCPRRAIEDLRLLRTYDPRGLWLEARGPLVEWMAHCDSRMATERLALAQELAEEDPKTPSRPYNIRFVIAELLNDEAQAAGRERERRDLRAAALEQLTNYRRDCTATGHAPAPEALRLQATLYREADDFESAIRTFNELIERAPGTAFAKQAKKEVDDLKLQVQLDKLEKDQGGRPSEAAEQAYVQATAAMRAGDFVAAERALDSAIADSPWFPKAHYALGIIHARNQRFAKAVEELTISIRMDRFDYEAQMALGLLYKKEFAGAEDERAIQHLKAALLLRPDLYHLDFHLGALYARIDRERARYHYTRFLNSPVPDDDPDREPARRARDELNRETTPDDSLFFVSEPPRDLRLEPELQRMINEAYLRVSEEQDFKAAERVLERARKKFPDQEIVLNELAKVAFALERTGDAREFWEKSLEMKEDQKEVHERLGLLLEKDLPRDGEVHLRRAADLGSTTARFRLAQLLWNDYSILDASEELDRYLQEASELDLYWATAPRLRERMDQVFLRIYLAISALLLALIAIPAWQIYRRLRGASLAQLLTRAPKSFPEVARILSLIRHEILKHNTAFLSDVGRALEMDEPDAEARAAIVARRLFGERRGGSPAQPDREGGIQERGIYGRFLGYTLELQKVGRSHGVTLNLYRKDPTFSAMIDAFEDLRGLAELPRTSMRERPTIKLEWARRLNRSGHVLGRKAFESLSDLIQSLCIVEVDAAFVHEVFRHVCAEAQFGGVQIAELAVSGTAARVRVFRTDLEDILTNVIRNSLHSSVLYAPKPIALGVALVTEMDEITGLVTLAIRIQDRSNEQLSNEMLRGRYVERGMGITADLLSRYDGSIAVEPEPGWQKAVVLRFFTVEEGS
ncbi:MAG: tetratricopeptide repeat protein [Myxococcales bacterium]|nr:tetratricopeptide repeat protein [Myxococcales bacterium]